MLILQNKENNDYLIEGLWILENTSGICVFEKIFSNLDTDGISTDLFSGFISALSGFVDEVFTDSIKHIQFLHRKLYFELKDNILFIFLINEKTKINNAGIKRLMNEIMNVFFREYKDKFECKDWYTRSADFNDFTEELEQIVSIGSGLYKFLNSSGPGNKIEKIFSHIV